jgi:hypothetical protein
VAEASEHVLRFDWADVAQQTRRVYAEATAGPATAAPVSNVARRTARRAAERS